MGTTEINYIFGLSLLIAFCLLISISGAMEKGAFKKYLSDIRTSKGQISIQLLGIPVEKVASFKIKLILLGLFVVVAVVSGILLDSKMSAELKKACSQADDHLCM